MTERKTQVMLIIVMTILLGLSRSQAPDRPTLEFQEKFVVEKTDFKADEAGMIDASAGGEKIALSTPDPSKSIHIIETVGTPAGQPIGASQIGSSLFSSIFPGVSSINFFAFRNKDEVLVSYDDTTSHYLGTTSIGSNNKLTTGGSSFTSLTVVYTSGYIYFVGYARSGEMFAFGHLGLHIYEDISTDTSKQFLAPSQETNPDSTKTDITFTTFKFFESDDDEITWIFGFGQGSFAFYIIDYSKTTDSLLELGDAILMEQKMENNQIGFEQNSLRKERILTGTSKTFPLLNYYDTTDALKFKLGTAGSSSEDPYSSLLGVSQILSIKETNMFLVLFATNFEEDGSNILGFADVTSIENDSDSNTIDIYDATGSFNNALEGTILSSLKNPRIASLTRFIEGENNFAFSVIHGNKQFEQDKAAVVVFDLTTGAETCHESCSTCVELSTSDRCSTCKEGYDFFPSQASEGLPILFGSCSQGLKMRSVTIATCGENSIPNCLACSRRHFGMCGICTFGYGLDGYSDDLRAGERCVQCPIENCATCEISSSDDTERTCSSCSGNLKLVEEIGGTFKCYSFMPLAQTLALFIYIFSTSFNK